MRTAAATAYRVIPLDQEIASHVRASLRAPDFGHPAYVDVAGGCGPCGLCLRKFDVGAERRILFTYDPFRKREPFPLPGPVFVHERTCTRYAGERFPAELADLPLTLYAYGAGCEQITSEHVVGTAAIESTVCRLLARPAVAYVHARNTAAGCFVCEFARV
jgi:hypothetical protein